MVFVKSGMRSFLLFTILGFALLGCTTPQDVRAVWTQPAAPSAHLAAPPGFMVSPARAHSAVWDSRALSLKHNWHIYADSRYYYVHDTFLGDGARRAFAQGIRVDGQTGEIVRR